MFSTREVAVVIPATEAIKTSALQEAIFNSAYFSSIATDEKGVIQIFNVGAERMLGYEAADVVNQITPADISDPDELVARAATLSAELETPILPGFEALVFKASRGIEDIYELTYVRKDGSRFPAIVSVTALRDVDDDIIGYLLIGTDNTARKQADAAQALLDEELREQRKRFERTLQQKNVELEHASRMKSEFLATMSHELRTPLNAIIGFSEALKDGLIGHLSDSQQDYIGDIFTSGQHLLSLINDILDLSKVEAGMMALELEAVDLATLLSNSLTIVKEKAANQHIHLELTGDDNLGAPVLDTRKTKQIVYNMLSNAVKFSAPGGSVELKVRRVARAAVGTLAGRWAVHSFPLADNEFDEFLEISVTDSGIGISAENMTKLFQPFSQIDSSLARKFEGTGLGLAMVRQLTELLGGAVAVASAEGEGACFVAWLPVRAADQATHTGLERIRSAGAAVTEPKARTVLVVEDDDRAAELVRPLLEAEGFAVIRAESAEVALQLAPQHELSLITLDVQLPGIDGWEFLLHLRKSGDLGRVPVVIISGLVDSNMALKGGASAVLEKPISRGQLKTALGNLGLGVPAEHTRTVLVVDDDPKAVEVIATFLPAPSYAVVRAYGGGEAITLAQRLLPDLILLDLMMPEVNGFDVVEALQRNAETSHIPILVVTARRVTAQDRAALNGRSGNLVEIVDKAGFNRGAFIAEVRRALLPRAKVV
jgi:signal transduction histidine kinase/CheY-like chemotaxis protein